MSAAITIELGPNDTAMVFRADGSEEIVTPGGLPSQIVGESAVKAMLCAIALHDPKIRRLVDEQINAMRDPQPRRWWQFWRPK